MVDRLLWRSFLNISFLKEKQFATCRELLVSGRVSSNSTNPYKWPGRWVNWGSGVVTLLITRFLWAHLVWCITNIHQVSLTSSRRNSVSNSTNLALVANGAGQKYGDNSQRLGNRRLAHCGCSRLGWVIFTPNPKLGERFVPFLGGQPFRPIFRGEDVRFLWICNGKGADPLRWRYIYICIYRKL